MRQLRKVYQYVLPLAVRHYGLSATSAIAFLAICGLLGARLGTEFLPKLEEGNLWIRGVMPPPRGRGRQGRYSMADYWSGEELKIDDKIYLAPTHPHRWAAMVVRVPASEQEGAQAVPAARRLSLLVAARL